MSSSRELAGRTALITGATSGIGAAVARRLADAGAELLVVARRAPGLTELASRLGAVAVPADVASESGIAALQGALAQRGADAPDIVVHAAGAFQLARLHETPVAEFDRMLAVNLRAAFLLARAFLPGMLRRGTGDLIALGSIAGRHAFPANGAYSASKFGLRGLFAVLAAELRGTGVRAALVEPAATDTPLWDVIDMKASPGLPARSAMLQPASVADAVWYAVTRPRDVVIANILVERS